MSVKIKLANAEVIRPTETDEFGVETIAVAHAKPAFEPSMAPGIKISVSAAKGGSGAARSTGSIHHPSSVIVQSEKATGYPTKLVVSLYSVHAKDDDGNYVVSDKELLSIKQALMKVWGHPKNALEEDGSNLKLGVAANNPNSAIDGDGTMHFTLDGAASYVVVN